MLKQLLSLTIFLFVLTSAQAQQYYENEKGQKHLWGTFDLEALQEAPFQEWYTEFYQVYEGEGKQKWAKKLKDYQVDIYLGTWCGDSKEWVPQFVHLWQDLGLDLEQLNFIALHNEPAHYKQGPNAEEKDKGIHRVPTFIFTENGEEKGRIVESPLNDLKTDVKQIALGCPSQARYRGVMIAEQVFAHQALDSILANPTPLMRAVYRYLNGSKELNTYGYVLKAQGEMEKALLIFRINNYLYKYKPNTYDSLGEQYFEMGEYEKARNCYEEVLRLKKEDEHASEMLAKIEAVHPLESIDQGR